MFVWNSLLLILASGFGNDRYDALITRALVEIHHAIYESVEGVVLTYAYIGAGVVLRAALANDDVTCDHFLATPNLHTESLRC